MRPFLRFPSLVAIFAVSLLSAHAGDRFSYAKTPGRLPKGVIPTAYEIRLEPSIETASVIGRERIELQVGEATRQLVLNSTDLTITSAILRQEGRPDAPLRVEAGETQLLTLTAEEEIPAGAYQLDLAWTGQLTERTEGLYITRYTTATGEKRALATEMEPTDARRMFPCWDEPVFRATFTLTAVVPQAHLALSNMPQTDEKALPDGRKEVRFGRTPAMATYLVAFAAGEFEALEDEVEGVKLRIVTTEGKKEQGRYAMEATKQILSYYNEYFGVRYPLPKLDQFCFPGFPMGGMENWGAIFYNDTTLLVNPAMASQSNRERVFGVVAHEIAHQWFGDLVTMAWWDDLWLNEGFASWMGTKVTAHLHPDWQMWLRAAGSKEFAMALDARRTTHPIQKRVETEAQANDSFDEITYSKGLSFLRMMEAYLGEAPFRDGIRAYMAKHAYSSATTADLWAALETNPEKPVREVAANWTEQPGFPLIRASSVCRDGKLDVTLSQERFTINQKDAPALTWQTPVTLAPLFALNHTRVVRLGGEPQVITFGTCDDLPKVNLGGAGYYRVLYDEETFARLSRVAASLPDAERLNLLADTWALVEAGRLPGNRIFELVRRICASETSYAVWRQIFSAAGTMDNLYVDEPRRAFFQDKGRGLLSIPLKRLGWEPRPGEPELDKSLRAEVLETAGRWEKPEVIAEAQRRFARFVEDRASLPGDLRRCVLHLAGRSADAATYEQIHEWAKRETSAELKNELYQALASNRDPELAQRTLAISLTDELAPNEASGLVSRVLHDGEHRALAWAFACEHLPELVAKLGVMRANNFLPGLARAFSDAAKADELEAIAKARLSPDATPSVEKAADEIRFKAALKQRLLPEFEAWAKNR
ncbi:MAG TPA: M1 family metallopeptidase [Chthoniobacteraceae bacterium]|jgi:aminopeptidase N|nr:M1 family metallopeptidase [Chthoniobacteraceae bacterium]